MNKYINKNYRIPKIKLYKQLINSILEREGDIRFIGDNFKITTEYTSENDKKTKYIIIKPDDARELSIIINDDGKLICIETIDYNHLTKTGIEIKNIDQINEEQNIFVQMDNYIIGSISNNDSDSFTLKCYGEKLNLTSEGVILGNDTYNMDSDDNLYCNGTLIDEAQLNSQTENKIEILKNAIDYLPYIQYYLLNSIFSDEEIKQYINAINNGKVPLLQEIMPIEELVDIVNICINSKNTYEIEKDGTKISKRFENETVICNSDHKGKDTATLVYIDRNKIGIVKKIIIWVYNGNDYRLILVHNNNKKKNWFTGIQKVYAEDFDLNNPNGGFRCYYENYISNSGCQVLSNDLEKMSFKPPTTKYNFIVDRNIIKFKKYEFIFNSKGEVIYIRNTRESLNKKENDFILSDEQEVAKKLLSLTSDKKLDYQVSNVYPTYLRKVKESAESTYEIVSRVRNNITGLRFYKHRMKKALEIISEEEQNKSSKAPQYKK